MSPSFAPAIWSSPRASFRGKATRFSTSGKVGAELTLEEGYAAARQCAINAIAQLKAAVGDLEQIRQIVRT